MKITFSNNMNDESVQVEATPDEVGGSKELKRLANKFPDQMRRAYDAAHLVWDKFPEFKSVTLDTMTVEERDMIEKMKRTNTKN